MTEHAPHAAHAISWSKNGFICYASDPAHGHNLLMTFIENTNGTDWQIAPPHKLTIKPSEGSAPPNLHTVQWSNLSTDLAILDEFGNFYILLAGVGLLKPKHEPKEVKNEPKEVKKDEDGPSYELTSYNHIEMIYRDIRPGDGGGHGRGVAFRWLGIEKPQIINQPAHMAGGRYVYGVQSHQASLAAHPISTKQACMAVRQDGSVTLYYQGEHKVQYHKMEASLAPVAGACMYVTHATIGFAPDKKICVTCYDAVSARLYCHLVSVDWGFLSESAARQRSDPHYHTPKDKQTPPKIEVELVHVMKPMPRAQGDAGTADSSDSAPSAASWTLLSVDCISPSHAAGSNLHILVTYEVEDEKRKLSYISQRYTLKNAQESLNGAFAAKEAERSAFSLEFQDSLAAPRKLKAILTALGETVVLFVHEDGSVMPISRQTWTVIESGKNQSVIESILDCGFRFPQLQMKGPFLYAVSPNMACVVFVDAGGPLELAVMERGPGEEKHLSAHEHSVAAAYSHTHAHACYSNSCSDDLMALVKAEYDQMHDVQTRTSLVRRILTESHCAINFQLNSFGKESVDKLLSNPPLQKLLSFQLVLSNLAGMSMAGDIAWIVLNLRSTSFGIMFSLSSIYRQISKKKPAQDTLADSVLRAECIVSLIGNVKWLIDLIIYLSQELLQLWYCRPNSSSSEVSVDNSIALPIILSKVPRLFLMYALSSIGKTQEILKKLHKDLSDSSKLYVPMKEALERFFSTCTQSPLKLAVFEGFLRECEAQIAKDPDCILNKKEVSLEAEKQLLCYGEVPESLRPMAAVIVDRHMAAFSHDPRLSDLYFYDNKWIGVGVAKKRQKTGSKRLKTGHGPKQGETFIRFRYSPTEAVDALRKIFIDCGPTISCNGDASLGKGYTSSNIIRKCVRCRSVSLVSDPLVFESASAIGLWTMVFQRTCICGSAWVNCERGR